MDRLEEYRATLAAVVRAEVAAQQLSTQQIVDRLGISYPSYRRYFLICERPPDVEQLLMVAMGLGMSGPVELLQRVDDRIRAERSRRVDQGEQP